MIESHVVYFLIGLEKDRTATFDAVDCTCRRPPLAGVDHLATDDEVPLEHILGLGVLPPPAVQHSEVATRRLL